MPDTLRELSHKVLLLANQGNPMVNFFIEAAGELLSFFKCSAIEMWLNDGNRCSRWVATKTPKMVFRLSDISVKTFESEIKRDFSEIIDEIDNSLVDQKRINKDYRSLGRFPITVGEETTGLLIIKDNRRDFFNQEKTRLCLDVAQILATTIAFQQARLQQKERAKELTCLYEIGKISSQPSETLDTILQSMLNCMPSAWQYPEIASAKVTLDGKTFSTKIIGNQSHSMKANIKVAGKKRGSIEVIYSEERPNIDEGPFLKEERRLIDWIAQEISVLVEQKQGESEREILLEQLRHADRLATIGQLAAGVAHELNEPLGGILGFAQLAQKNADLPIQARDDLKKIEDSSLYAREVIRKLMLFARQAPQIKKRVNLNQIAEDGLFFFEARCSKLGINLVRDLDPSLPAIIGDRAQLNQVLINLVVNSIQAMPKGGKLTIQTKKSARYVTLVISDTGMGMDKNTLQHVFDPFFTTKDVGEGTGLGLAVVHGIIMSHGGRIKFSSRLGHSTKCEVKFPVKEASIDR